MIKYLLLLFLVGCSESGSPNLQNVTADADIQKILREFNSDISRLGKLPVDFSRTTFVLDNSATDISRGKCERISVNHGTFTVIRVNSKLLTDYYLFKKILLYHECGHCFLGLQHVTGYEIMNPHIPIADVDFYFDNTRLELVKHMLDASPNFKGDSKK